MKTKTVALIYDFDGTLSPDNMQEYGFIEAIGKDKREFWTKTNVLSEENDASRILCYMYLMIKTAEGNEVSLKRDSFQRFGEKIALFDGVKEWFSMMNAYAQSIGIELKHYINSSGLKEMIEGTVIYKEFENVYACSFLYNVDGVAYWPAIAVDYTTKTQFLFKINKGIKDVSDDTKINQFIPEEQRPIPFKNMIYFGDGATDIPCMKMVKEHGGHSIAVYDPCNEEKKQNALQLITDNRVNFVCPANYTETSEMCQVVKRILDKIKADMDFSALLSTHQSKVNH